jgi:hypothetical protein
MMVVGDDGRIKLSGEPERKGMPKFAHLPAPLDAPVLQDNLCDMAHRLSYSTLARVVRMGKFVMNSGGQYGKIASNREG